MTSTHGFARVCGLVLLAAAVAAPAPAQDFRGAITGRVTDTSNAVLPGATVTATNTATNQPTSSVTNSDGLYNLLFLTPGIYNVVTELPGFKKLERQRIEVRVGDRLTLDQRLELGGVEETISVTSAAPLLDLSSASSGQVIDEQRIALLPLSDGNPFTLARLVPGVAFTGDLKFSRPFDNAGSSAINADGSSGGNEFSLDGSPNMANGRRVAFVPPAGAVQEFRVSTASFDAADGHTAGALVNVTLKSGTNGIKGQGYFYMRDEKLSATDFFVNKAGGEKPPLMYNRFGGSGGGPLRRDRTFLFAAVEWLYDEFPEPLPQTVPTEAMRNGDFSALLGQGITIYDPATARLEGGFVTRSPFPGNMIPAEPHQPGGARGDELLPGAQPGRRRAGPEQFLFDQSPHRRFLFGVDARRSSPDVETADHGALRAQRSPRVAQRVLRRGQRRGAGGQFPVPQERRGDGGSRVYGHQLDAAQRPRRLVAFRRTEHPAA